jgi:hypothetical protein
MAAAVVFWAAAAAAENRLELGADQTVTVAGSFGSLKGLLEDLCDQGGIELRSFDAADRSVTVRYEGVPLTTALRGLLREESYLLGVAAQPGAQGTRVTWIRIMAKGDGATSGGAVPTGASMVSRAASTPPVAPAPAADEDPARIAQIAGELANRLFARPEQVGPFLETSPQVIAGTFRKYPEAKAIVRQLVDEQSDPAIRAKLEQVLETLR